MPWGHAISRNAVMSNENRIDSPDKFDSRQLGHQQGCCFCLACSLMEILEVARDSEVVWKCDDV